MCNRVPRSQLATVELNFVAWAIGLCAALFLFCNESFAETVSGLQAIVAVIGKPVVVQNNNEMSTYNFDSAFEFRLKRAAPFNDEIKGRVTRGVDSSKVCFSYANALPTTCFQLDVSGNKFIMTARGGFQTIGTILPPPASKPNTAAKPVEQGDPRICKSLRSIANAAVSKQGLDALIDRHYPPINPSNGELDALSEVFRTTVKLGECLVDPGSTVPRLNCMMPMKPNDPEAVKLYLFMVDQVKLCLGEKLIASKPSKVIKKNLENQPVAFSSYTLKKGVELAVDLRNMGRCLDMIYDECTDHYGVYVKVEDRRFVKN